jgi:hypothetical protein
MLYTSSGDHLKHFRSLILSLALAVIAFGLTRLDAALKAAPPVMSGAAGDVLFASAFEQDTAEWETFEGRLSSKVEGGILKIDVGTENAAPFVPTRWHFGDFDLRVAAAAVGGPVENGYGVMFRVRDAKNYYSFIITSDGYYRLAKAVDGVEREISTYIPSDAILTDFGAGNTIRVQGISDTFRFWINDEPVQLCLADDPDGASTYSGGECFGTMTDAYTDATHTAGRIGLIGVSGMEPDVSVVFDNLVITMPE